ncbi:S24 family peptidase [Vibrio sp. SCSIO 43136]|uniref:LexA family protein n=1 Tax=Vibrio sp. SCSIO 43136 TaxID=2819101 RepID=UPI002075F242|nr:S24 family peptidase [Vibrio sp. SCSIO 43136]USD68103.1 helix-turn-helix domain-containing protein [Vibrio sp. SCSIO 43136]
MSKETIGERIRRVRKELKLSQQELAKRVGVSATSVVFWERDENKPKDLIAVCEVLRVNPNWLKTGQGEREITSNIVPVESQVCSNNTAFPVISMVSAGAWMEAVEPYHLSAVDEYLETTERASENSFWVKVIGDSMTTPSGLSFPDGMYILVDPEVEAINKSFVVAKLKSVNEVTFKQLILEAGLKFLKPLNPNPIYQPMPINGDCKIVGVVIDAKWKLR